MLSARNVENGKMLFVEHRTGFFFFLRVGRAVNDIFLAVKSGEGIFMEFTETSGKGKKDTSVLFQNALSRHSL